MTRLVKLADHCYAISPIPLFASSPLPADAEAMMQAIKAKMQAAKTYTATMKIKVDVSFMNAPESEAKIYYKAPDKTHIESEGFAMIPKQGADLSAAKLLSTPYTAVDAGTAKFHGKTMRRVKIIPLDEDSPIAVATIYIDTTLMVPRKVVTTSKQGGTYTAELVYDNAEARAYALPSYVKLIFEIGNFDLPKSMTGDFDGKKKAEDGKQEVEEGKAQVQIWYKNYELNVNIPDSVFED